MCKRPATAVTNGLEQCTDEHEKELRLSLRRVNQREDVIRGLWHLVDLKDKEIGILMEVVASRDEEIRMLKKLVENGDPNQKHFAVSPLIDAKKLKNEAESLAPLQNTGCLEKAIDNVKSCSSRKEVDICPNAMSPPEHIVDLKA